MVAIYGRGHLWKSPYIATFFCTGELAIYGDPFRPNRGAFLLIDFSNFHLLMQSIERISAANATESPNEANMTAETLKVFAPCPKHRLWKDVSVECFYCVVEQAAVAPLPAATASVTA